MAVAGKVAITLSTENGGAWSADVTYDRLVAVKHNNNLYISRKTVANVEPPNDEFWFLALEGFSGDDIEDIIDGSTQVGNAKTLDGHEASYFAQLENTVKRINLKGQLQTTDYRKSVIALCETSEEKVLLDSVSNGTITIHRVTGYLGSEARVNVLMAGSYQSSNNVSCAIEVLSGGQILKPCTFTYNGKIYGGIEVFMEESYSNFIEFYGMTNFDIFGLDYYDTKNDVALNEEIANSISYDIYSYVPFYYNGKKVATEVDLANYFKNTGGEIDGNVTLKGDGVARFLLFKNPNRVLQQVLYENGNYVFYDYTNNQTVFDTTVGGINSFHGTASENIKYTDKPTGTYTGNGDATERQIAVGGIGNILAIAGNATFAIASAGGIIGHSNGTLFATTSGMLYDGVLFVGSTHEALNANGVKYTYWLL